MKTKSKELTVQLMVVGVLINVGVGALIRLLNLPIYLDAIGTIVTTILLGFRAGAISGVVSFVLMTVTGLGPLHIYFSLTQVAIAFVTHHMARLGMFRDIWRLIVTSLVMGLVAAVVSAPVIVYMFGGVEGNGAGLITAFLVKTGKTIVESVVLKGLSIEPFDKFLQCLLVFLFFRSISQKFLQTLGSPHVDKNFIQGEENHNTSNDQQ